MFKFNKKRNQVTYTIWENGVPTHTDVDFGDYCFYVEEILPYFIREEQGVALIQVLDANDEVLASYEFFHMDGKDYQSKYVPDIPLEEGAFKFGVTRL